MPKRLAYICVVTLTVLGVQLASSSMPEAGSSDTFRQLKLLDRKSVV